MAITVRSARDEALGNTVIMRTIVDGLREEGQGEFMDEYFEIEAISRVSKAWREIAMPAIFQALGLEYKHHVAYFDELPDRYLLHVRRIWLFRHWPGLQFSHITVADALSILLRCPNLITLDMPGYAEDLYRAIFAIQSLPRHWKDLTRVCLGQVTVNGFRFLSKCPQVRILELDTDKYREEYLAEYGDPVALMGSWPVQAQPLNITKLYLTLGDVKDLVLVKLLPNLRTLLLEPPVTGCKSPFGGDVWETISEIGHPSLESIKCHYHYGIPSQLKSPAEWEGATDLIHSFATEKQFISDCLAGARNRMPNIRNIELSFLVQNPVTEYARHRTTHKASSMDLGKTWNTRQLQLQASFADHGCSILSNASVRQIS